MTTLVAFALGIVTGVVVILSLLYHDESSAYEPDPGYLAWLEAQEPDFV